MNTNGTMQMHPEQVGFLTEKEEKFRILFFFFEEFFCLLSR